MKKINIFSIEYSMYDKKVYEVYEKEGSLVDYVESLSEDDKDYYLNWSLNESVKFDEKRLEGVDVVILRGEERIEVIGVGEKFNEIVNMVRSVDEYDWDKGNGDEWYKLELERIGLEEKYGLDYMMK